MSFGKFTSKFFVYVFFIISILNINYTNAIDGKDKEDNLRKGVIVSSGALGGWIGSGLATKAIRTIAEHLYAKESDNVLSSTLKNIQVADFVEGWRIPGKAIGAAAGSAVFIYSSTTVYDNYPSWMDSWKKLGNSILKWDFENITNDDVRIYIG